MTTNRWKIVFVGTPEFAAPTFDAILSDQDNFEVVACITKPPKPAGRDMAPQKTRIHIMAEHYHASLHRHAKRFPILTPDKINDPKVYEELMPLRADLAVVVAYGQIMSEQFFNCFKFGAVNLHASLLPKWRGAAPIAWALLNNDAETGVTLQRMVKELDAGPIIAQVPVGIGVDWDAPKLYAELAKKGAELSKKSILDYLSGKIKPVPQDPTKVTIARKITKEDGKIDFNENASKTVNQIRALQPWPGTHTTRNGKSLKVLRAQAVLVQAGEIGEVISADAFGFAVQCGHGTALRIMVVQPESRARQTASEYLNGNPFKRGDKLGT